MGDGKALAHGYRSLQHWNEWLTHQFLGQNLLQTEQRSLSQMLDRHYGKHALLLGVPEQQHLLNATLIPCHSFLSPIVAHEKKFSFVEADFHELPILTGSIDLVLLPHTLEFVDNPRQLLAEACRIIKPEGLIAICGFNPYSMWGLRKLFHQQKHSPWSANFILPHKIKRWLQLADFKIEQQQFMLFRPPIEKKNLYERLKFFEYIGNKCFPFLGGIYMINARAKVIPLTPIKLKWKQELGGIRISTSVSGHIAHSSK